MTSCVDSKEAWSFWMLAPACSMARVPASASSATCSVALRVATAFSSIWRMLASISVMEEEVSSTKRFRFSAEAVDLADGGHVLGEGRGDRVHGLREAVRVARDLVDAGDHLEDRGAHLLGQAREAFHEVGDLPDGLLDLAHLLRDPLGGHVVLLGVAQA